MKALSVLFCCFWLPGMVFSHDCFQHLCFATYVDVHAHAFSRALPRERQAAAILNHIE